MKDAELTRGQVELKERLSPDIPYHIASMFPETEGFFVSQANDAKVYVIRNAEPKFREKGFLREGEAVLYVAKGLKEAWSGSGLLGAMVASVGSVVMAPLNLLGLIATSVNRTLFVLTDRRILLLSCDSDGGPREMVWHVLYQNIVQSKSKGTYSLDLQLEKGGTVTFRVFRAADVKAMNSIITVLRLRRAEAGGEVVTTRGVDNLCPRCFVPVKPGEYECPDCGTRFVRPFSAMLRAFIFPAWGGFGVKEHFLGVLWFAAEVALVAVVVFGLLKGQMQAAAIGGGGLLLHHFIAGCVAYGLAKKGFFSA